MHERLSVIICTLFIMVSAPLWSRCLLIIISAVSGGSKPNLADLAVFGVLRPIRYLRSGRDMVEHTRIGEWYSRMESAVGESSRIKA